MTDTAASLGTLFETPASILESVREVREELERVKIEVGPPLAVIVIGRHQVDSIRRRTRPVVDLHDDHVAAAFDRWMGVPYVVLERHQGPPWPLTAAGVRRILAACAGAELRGEATDVDRELLEVLAPFAELVYR